MSDEDAEQEAGGSALEAFADACIEAWSALLSASAACPLALSNEGIESIAASAVDGGADEDADADEQRAPIALAYAPATGDIAGVMIALQAPDAAAFHALISGRAAEAIDEARSQEFGEVALREIDAWLGRSLRALAAPFQDAEALTLGDPLPSLVVRGVGQLDTWIAGPAERLRIALTPEGAEAIRAELYLCDAAPAAAVLRGAHAVLVIAPPAQVRGALPRLERELGRAVRHLEVADLPRDFGVYAEIACFVVAWDQGRGTGLDVVEQIRKQPSLATRPIALASPEPTAEMVRAGLRGGATTFLHFPLDPAEARARLLPSDPGPESESAEA